MSSIRYEKTGDELTIFLSGRVDSANAGGLERDIAEVRAQEPAGRVVLDCTALDYISSAGLRVILRLKKDVRDVCLVNVSSEIYEIFDMTGFTEMMDVRRAYRTISVEGCEVIGQGANGRVYRIDRDTIVKVYLNPDSLDDIHRERELARTAFVLGVPTAIPYDVVRIAEGGYGSVFELLNAKSQAKLLIDGEKTVDEIAAACADILHTVHATELQEGLLPKMKEIALKRAAFLKDYLPASQGERIIALLEALPENNHMLHGDFQIKNVMVQNGESLLIDMDTLCTGDPVFEFAGIYVAYQGYAETDHDNPMQFFGVPYETVAELWQKILHRYFAGKPAEYLQSVEDRATLIGSCRILRRTIRTGGLDTEEGRKKIDACRRHIAELTERVESLAL